MEIEIGKTYDYFDDGKISESRRLPVTITEVIPFSDIDSQILSDWKGEVEECNWLYAKETDFFIKGILKFSDNENKEIIFVRTIKGDWFSLGWWGGRLDVDGSLKSMLN
jgi:hypothetical protein